MTDHLELRTSTAAEFRDVAELVAAAFLHDTDDEALAALELVHEPERTHVVFDRGQLVATGGVLTREMTVPGAVVPVAHVTDVAVAPTHRRRGLLSRIMAVQLDEISLGTEPVAALWASEGSIYGRFGYGAAAWHVWYSIPTAQTELPGESPFGRLRQARPRDVLDRLAGVYDRVRVDRPGLSSRPGNWWEHLTADPKVRRRGWSAQRAVLYENGGAVDGYGIWRVKDSWSDTGPDGEVEIREVVAATPDAYAAIWRFLLSVDLTRTVKYPGAAVDEPLPHLLSDPQAMRATLNPSVWIRIVEVPGALSARRYAAPVDVVLEVSDALVPANTGRWRLVGDRSSAKCERTDADPDLSLGIGELGAAYLGGTSLVSLAAAGRVTELRRGALADASTAFGWHRAPTTFEVF